MSHYSFLFISDGINCEAFKILNYLVQPTANNFDFVQNFNNVLLILFYPDLNLLLVLSLIPGQVAMEFVKRLYFPHALTKFARFCLD